MLPNKIEKDKKAAQEIEKIFKNDIVFKPEIIEIYNKCNKLKEILTSESVDKNVDVLFKNFEFIMLDENEHSHLKSAGKNGDKDDSIIAQIQEFLDSTPLPEIPTHEVYLKDKKLQQHILNYRDKLLQKQHIKLVPSPYRDEDGLEVFKAILEKRLEKSDFIKYNPKIKDYILNKFDYKQHNKHNISSLAALHDFLAEELKIESSAVAWSIVEVVDQEIDSAANEVMNLVHDVHFDVSQNPNYSQEVQELVSVVPAKSKHEKMKI